MEHEPITLTAAERLILDSYRDLVWNLAEYLGEGYEVVLHSLESMERSVIAIANGHHTGRKEGSPITDLALQLLTSIQQDGAKDYMSYFSHNRDGETLRCSTMVIRGVDRRPIGLLCLNFYLNTPIYKVLSNFAEPTPDNRPFLSETFAENSEELLLRMVSQIRRDVEADDRILPSLRNKEIIQRCSAQGVFQLKSAVALVAKALGISKNTVYLHLKSVD